MVVTRNNATSHEPVPFRNFILKIASRCNLNCTYCYEYNHPDQSWRAQPRFMTTELIQSVAARIAEHVQQHELPYVHISLHGGEPLLLGVSRLGQILDILERGISPWARLTWGIQTNGTLLSAEWADMFSNRDVPVTVSVDGPPDVNDGRRVNHLGNGSYEETRRGIEILRIGHPEVFAGLFAVIDIEADPIEVVDHLVAFAPPAIDLLLPDGNWLLPPVRQHASSGDDYGKWLARVFDAWLVESRWGAIKIRMFTQLLKLLLGGRNRLDTFGSTPSANIVVATDGSLLAMDSLKSAYHGAPDLGLKITESDFDTALQHPRIIELQSGLQSLCATCRACPWVESCGGGYFPHRYAGAPDMFHRPSVYCNDFLFLFDHMARRIAECGQRLGAIANDEYPVN